MYGAQFRSVVSHSVADTKETALNKMYVTNKITGLSLMDSSFHNKYSNESFSYSNIYIIIISK